MYDLRNIDMMENPQLPSQRPFFCIGLGQSILCFYFLGLQRKYPPVFAYNKQKQKGWVL